LCAISFLSSLLVTQVSQIINQLIRPTTISLTWSDAYAPHF